MRCRAAVGYLPTHRRRYLPDRIGRIPTSSRCRTRCATWVVKGALSPFHNWLATTLKQFAIANLANRTSCRFRCAMNRNCFVRWNSRVGREYLHSCQRQHLATQFVALSRTSRCAPVVKWCTTLC